MNSQPISEILSRARSPLLSYEFFPPKDDAALDALRGVADELTNTSPDFVTVTYGAGGSTRQRTLQVCEQLAAKGLAPVMHHLTCVGTSRAALIEIIHQIHAHGIRNIMALRGDPPRGETRFQKHPDGLAHAVDLVKLIKAHHPEICCGVASYPETHQEALSPESDILYLKDKLDAGAAFVTTQLFFDNKVYFDFVAKCREWSIRAPIIPGLMPPTSLHQLRRMSDMCNAKLPTALVQDMEKAGDDAERTEAVGIEWTVAQIKELLKKGAPGIHLYILNRSKAALAPAVKSCFGR